MEIEVGKTYRDENNDQIKVRKIDMVEPGEDNMDDQIYIQYAGQANTSPISRWAFEKYIH